MLNYLLEVYWGVEIPGIHTFCEDITSILYKLLYFTTFITLTITFSY